MTNKHEVMAINREHPDWTARQIADHLGCMPEYVHKVKELEGLKIPRATTRTKVRA